METTLPITELGRAIIFIRENDILGAEARRHEAVQGARHIGIKEVTEMLETRTDIDIRIIGEIDTEVGSVKYAHYEGSSVRKPVVMLVWVNFA